MTCSKILYIAPTKRLSPNLGEISPPPVVWRNFSSEILPRNHHYPGSRSRTIYWMVLEPKRPWNFSRDLLHQQFQGRLYQNWVGWVTQLYIANIKRTFFYSILIVVSLTHRDFSPRKKSTVKDRIWCKKTTARIGGIPNLLPSRKLTFSPRKIGRNPKGSDRIPTIHF